MDRRRFNGPVGGTSAPIYTKQHGISGTVKSGRPTRTRAPNVPRKMFLKTGVTPSASGSAYLELVDSKSLPFITPGPSSLSTIGLKLTCTVHGPRPLPRSAPFSPHTILSTHVKYAPFASRKRRGYLRDASERDLAVHLQAALRGIIIGDRWPKSGMEVIITILEGEEDQWWGDDREGGTVAGNDWGIMSVLSGCITVASAAIADAGIDCVDIVSGGVAAIVEDEKNSHSLVLDPVPSEHHNIIATCVVGYSPSREEITELWLKGNIGLESSSSFPALSYEHLIDNAIQAALGSYRVLGASLRETADMRLGRV